ncbi:MAG: periplasmic heavy metal sensor [Xenophilus sp.]
MKAWIRRSLFGLFGGALVAGSLAGCADRHRHGWGGADSAEFRERIVARMSSRLGLDAAQRAKLNVLADRLQALREAGGGETRSQFKALFAADKLDRQRAAQLVDEKTAAVRTGSADVIAAAGDFFDSLNPAQQQKVREFMDRGGRRWGRHG